MEKNKKLVLSSIVLMSTALLGVTLVCNKGLTSFSVVGGDVPSHNLTLTEANAPTLETEYQASVTYTGVEHTQFTFTNVKAAEDALCTLGEGGTLTKVDAALGLESVTVTFTGTLTVETRFSQTGAVTEYPLTSGVETFLCGNYFAVTASTETTITSLSLNYLCTSGYNEGHELHETTETVLNGTDLDKVWKCQYCDYREARVDKTGFNTYRTGALEVFSKDGTNPLTLTTVDESVGGVTGATKLSGTGSKWDNKLHFELFDHASAATTRNNILNEYKITAVSFKIYMATGSTLRIASPDPYKLAGTTYHSYTFLSAAGTWTQPTKDGEYASSHWNPHHSVYDEAGKLVDKVVANTWYTYVISFAEIVNQPSGQYHCIEVVTPNGDVYFDDIRYCHDTYLPVLPELGFVYNTVNTGAVTLSKTQETVAGVTAQYKTTGTGSWKDQVDISWMSTNTLANGGIGLGTTSTQKYIWVMNRWMLATKSYTFDLYLSAGSSVRLQSRINNTTDSHYTNIITAGGTYDEHVSGKFNTAITVTDANGVEITKGGAVAANAWYKVTISLASLQNIWGTSGGYMTSSLVAPIGTIYLANLTHNR